MRSVYLLFIFLFLGCAPGQWAYKRGEKNIEKGEFDPAVEHFYEAIEKGYKDANSYYYIGEAYRLSNRIDRAKKYYLRAIKTGTNKEDAYIGLYQALQTNGKYDSAKLVLENYLETGEDEEVLEKANYHLTNLTIFMEEVLDKESYYRVKSLNELNTKYAEYSPVYSDGKLYFTSNRDANNIYPGTGTPYSDIYEVETKGAVVSLETLRKLPAEINEQEVNEGVPTFSRDGKVLVFAKGNTGKRKGRKEVSLYISFLRGKTWTEPRLLRINDPDSWDSTPSFSPDGRTLYFSSNREGGEGGTDIYVATMDSRGRFVDVRSAGDKINTPGNEMFPYFGVDGKLYFASDGHPGFGGLDMYSAFRENGQFRVVNLGKPMNTSSDDFGIFLFQADRGFFSSNRESGAGDDDIYTFLNEDPNLKIVNYFLTGITVTTDEKNDSVKVLPNTKVKLFASSDDEMIEEAFTGLDGTFQFRLYENEDYYLYGEKDGYFTTRLPYSMKGRSISKDTLEELVTNVNYDTLLRMDRIILEKVIVLENIYYDLDKAYIRPDAAKELDKLVNIMKDNESITIELSSHTDARAPEQYNMELSQRRADSAVAYIIRNGIDAERMAAKGYGESQLIIENATTEEEHQVNRRTEFKVTGFKGSKPGTTTQKADTVSATGDDRFFNDDSRFFDNSP